MTICSGFTVDIWEKKHSIQPVYTSSPLQNTKNVNCYFWRLSQVIEKTETDLIEKYISTHLCLRENKHAKMITNGGLIISKCNVTVGSKLPAMMAEDTVHA